MDPWLAAHLQRHPQPCPICAKPLELRDNQCAHCRNVVLLGLSSTSTYQLAWGLLLCALGGIAGIGVFFDVVALTMLGNFHVRTELDVLVLCMMAFGPLATAALLLTLSRRQAYFRRSKMTRWAITLFSAAILLTIILCYTFIRR